jgi:opacity protein-like surface antigen
MLVLARLLLFVLFLFAMSQAGAVETAPITPSPARPDAVGTAISGDFDGRSYAADFGQDDKKAGGKDVVEFANGLMSTRLCVRFGFQPAPYLVRVEGRKVHFYSEMISKEQGKIVFSGYVEDGKLKADAKWAQARWYWTVNVGIKFDGALTDPKADLPVFVK